MSVLNIDRVVFITKNESKENGRFSFDPNTVVRYDKDSTRLLSAEINTASHNGIKSIFESFVSRISSNLLESPTQFVLFLFHTTELEKFRRCEVLRRTLKEEYPNYYYFTYTIGGVGNPFHYGFVFKKLNYPDFQSWRNDLKTVNIIDDNDLLQFSEELKTVLDVKKSISLYHYSSYYPHDSSLPKSLEDKLAIQQKFYKEVYDKWDYSFCFKNETMYMFRYPEKEYEQFYYTEDKSKNSDYDLRRYFYDSSIWFRYLYNESGKNQKDDLVEYKDKYKDYFKLTTAKVSKFFHIRMFENSFVLGGQSSHGRHVVPFKFHSETLMAKLADSEKSKISSYLQKSGLESWSWDVLLIDDYAKTALKGDDTKMIFSSDDYKGQEMTKNNVIKHTLDIDDKGEINLDKTNSKSIISVNINCQEEFPDPDLHKKWYEECSSDILLVDYLFTRHTKDEEPRFGDEIVKTFVNDHNSSGLLRSSTPLGKQWVFPVSAFNFVFTDSISSQGLDYFGSNMILSSGGDPITTPNLFRYRFYRFLRLQLEEFGINAAEELLDYLNEMGKELLNVRYNPSTHNSSDRNKKNAEFKVAIKSMFPTVANLVAKYRLFVEQIDHRQLGSVNTIFGADVHVGEEVQSFIYRIAYSDTENNLILQKVLENISHVQLRESLKVIWKGNG